MTYCDCGDYCQWCRPDLCDPATIPDTPQWRTAWLTHHAKADIIVYDLKTDAPHSAIYRPNGAYPVAYLYPSDEGVNL